MYWPANHLIERISSRKAINIPNIGTQHAHSEKQKHRTAVDTITATMAKVTILKSPTRRPQTECRNDPRSIVDDVTAMMASNRISQEPAKPPPPPTNFPPPPETLPLPPTELGASLGTQPETTRARQITLNCRYRVPNSYLNVYHRRGQMMLCMPWETPWLDGENGAV